MEEYKDISRGLKMLLDKAEEMGWNWEAYIEPGSRRTYVEIGQSSPAGEDFSMVIDRELHIDCGMVDAEVADAIIQYALFGEIIYG